MLDALVAADLIVWGETAVPGGPEWAKALERTAKARCLVVCWSAAALANTDEAAAFRAAALDGCAQNKTIGVLFEQVSPPEGFGCTLYDLSGWRCEPQGWRKWLIGDAHLRDVVAAAKSKQANRDPAPPSAPRKLLMRQLAVLFSATVVPLVAVISFTDVALNFQGRIAARPSDEEQAAWDKLPAGDCEALRRFVSSFPNGAYRDQADVLIGAARKGTRTEWRRTTLEEEIYLPHSAGGTKAHAQKEGARRCAMLIQGTESRLIGTTMRQVRQDCQFIDGKHLCDWRGTAACEIEEPIEIKTERCGD
ncbi:hypothetical protein MTR66_20350 [Novosphingobium sp. 2638]|uniref:TIR domain-containing protein n=1 Tax=Novosphingobium beihaiensis TaxID=2930389 RepID=A0ABT0BVR5_9SPHN|nr:hypothetical protein [Novosphingobium beihaiensis]